MAFYFSSRARRYTSVAPLSWKCATDSVLASGHNNHIRYNHTQSGRRFYTQINGTSIICIYRDRLRTCGHGTYHIYVMFATTSVDS